MVQERLDRIGSLAVHVFSPTSIPSRGAVVLVHGVCSMGRLWKNWATSLAQRGIEAHCIDLRGHGDSGNQDVLGQTRLDDYAADVDAILSHTGAHAIIGHDMGGLVGQLVASRRELRALVLVSTVAPKGVGGPSSLDLLWRELRPRYVRAMLRGKPWRPAEADFLHTCCEKLSLAGQQELLAMLGAESGLVAREIVVAGTPIEEGSIRCPVLVVASTFDRLTPPARQRLVASRYHADYVEFAQHGHVPMLEPGWERPAAVIGRWLEDAARIGDLGRISSSRLAARKATDGSSYPPSSRSLLAAAPVAVPTEKKSDLSFATVQDVLTTPSSWRRPETPPSLVF